MSSRSRTRPEIKISGWSMVVWVASFAILAVLAIGFAITGSTGAAFAVAGAALLFGAVLLEVHRRGSSRLSHGSAARSDGALAQGSGTPAGVATADTHAATPARSGPGGVHFRGRRQGFLVLFGLTVGGLICAGIAGLSVFAFVYGAVRGHFGLAVIPGMLFALPAHRMLRGVAGQLWAGLSGRPRGVWLTEQGVNVRLDRSVQLPWSDITAIRTATTSLGRGFGPRIAQNWVHVAVADEEAYWLRQGWRGRIALRRQGDVAVGVTQVHLEQELRLLTIGLRHYLNHPADRAELSGTAAAAISRIEAATR